MKKNKYIKLTILIISVIAVISACLYFNFRQNETKQTKEDIFVSSALEDYGNSSFTTDNINKHTKDKVYKDEYILNKDSFLTNMSDFHLAKKAEKKLYPKLAKEMQKSIEDALISDDKLQLSKQDTTKNSEGKKETVMNYKYKGNNIFMYQYDLNELGSLISFDMGKIVSLEDIKTPEEGWTYMAMGVVRAMKIMENHYDFYQEKESRDINVVLEKDKDTFTIMNASTLMLDLKGFNSNRVAGKGMDYNDNVFIPNSKKRAKKYYDDAIKDKIYNPKDPFSVPE